MEMSIDVDLNRATLGGSGRLWYFKVQKRYLTPLPHPATATRRPPSPSITQRNRALSRRHLASDEDFTFSRPRRRNGKRGRVEGSKVRFHPVPSLNDPAYPLPHTSPLLAVPAQPVQMEMPIDAGLH